MFLAKEGVTVRTPRGIPNGKGGPHFHLEPCIVLRSSFSIPMMFPY